MGESAHKPEGRSAQSVAHNNVAVRVKKPGGKTAPKSNLIGELIKARQEDERSMRYLAAKAGVTPGAIKQLENGKGTVATLVAVLNALPFQVAGLAPGRTFAEQLQNRRAKKGMSLETVATKASLPRQEIVKLENGEGSVQNLLRLLAVIAPKVSRFAPERIHWALDVKLARDSRFTPASFMEPIYHAFGEIDLDPCGHPSSPVIARRRFILSDGDDGLTTPWSGRFVFVNPPYSKQLDWVRRAHNQWEAGNVNTVVCLVPTRTDSEFFHDKVLDEADLYLLQGRLRFLKEAGKPQATPFSLMVVAFGATTPQRARFAARVPGRWIAADDPMIVHCGTSPDETVIPDRTSEQFSESCSQGIFFADCRPRAVRVCHPRG